MYVVLDVDFAVFSLNDVEERAIQALDYIMFKEDIQVFRDRSPTIIRPRELSGDDSTI